MISSPKTSHECLFKTLDTIDLNGHTITPNCMNSCALRGYAVAIERLSLFLVTIVAQKGHSMEDDVLLGRNMTQEFGETI